METFRLLQPTTSPEKPKQMTLKDVFKGIKKVQKQHTSKPKKRK